MDYVGRLLGMTTNSHHRWFKQTTTATTTKIHRKWAAICWEFGVAFSRLFVALFFSLSLEFVDAVDVRCSLSFYILDETFYSTYCMSIAFEYNVSSGQGWRLTLYTCRLSHTIHAAWLVVCCCCFFFLSLFIYAFFIRFGTWHCADEAILHVWTVFFYFI